MQTRNAFSWLKKEITRSISVSLMIYINTRTSIASTYPTFAQQGYENPREATGRIVCANFHLANKPVEIEVPQAVLPDTVFEAVVRIPRVQFRFDCLQHGSRFPKKSLGTMKKSPALSFATRKVSNFY